MTIKQMIEVLKASENGAVIMEGGMVVNLKERCAKCHYEIKPRSVWVRMDGNTPLDVVCEKHEGWIEFQEVLK